MLAIDALQQSEGRRSSKKKKKKAEKIEARQVRETGRCKRKEAACENRNMMRQR